MYKIIIVFLFFYSICCYGQADLQYSLPAFNSDTCCWRMLSIQGKYLEAANLIIRYKELHKHEGKFGLNWHAGQLFAMGGDVKQARRYFKKTYSIFGKWFGGEDGATWYFFAKGTLAFAERDKNKLARMMRKWQRRYDTNDGNYKELTKLYANWDKPYSEAYK